MRQHKILEVRRRPLLHKAPTANHHAQAHGQQQNSRPAFTSLRGTRRWMFGHAYAASGNSIRNVVPWPTSEVKFIEPLCSCTMRNVLANPIPLPPGLVVKNN